MGNSLTHILLLLQCFNHCMEIAFRNHFRIWAMDQEDEHHLGQILKLRTLPLIADLKM